MLEKVFKKFLENEMASEITIRYNVRKICEGIDTF